MNFTVVEGGIVIRLGTGWAAFHLNGAAVTFEADQAAASRHSGWSVVVEGIARIVPYDDVARLGANLPTPIVSVPGVRVFEIVPFKVTGRAVEPDLRGDRSDPVAGLLKGEGERPQDLHLECDAAEALSSVLRSVLSDLSSEIAGARTMRPSGGRCSSVAVYSKVLRRRSRLPTPHSVVEGTTDGVR